MLDLVASMPFELIGYIFGLDNQNLRLVGMLKLVRILRLGRIISFLRTNPNFKFGLKILQILIIILLLFHWVNCYFAFVVLDDEIWIPPKDVDFRHTELYDN